MRHVANQGYSKKWMTGDRIAGTTSGEDPRYVQQKNVETFTTKIYVECNLKGSNNDFLFSRVKRDIEERQRRIQQFSLIIVIACDIPWLAITVWNGTNHKLNTFGILSVASSGLGKI